jgi:methyl-accepting chemotaxis protein
MDTSAGIETAAAEAPRTRRRVRNYLLDTSLQLRLAAYLLAVAVTLSAVLGWLLWNAYSETTRVLALADPDVGASLARDDQVRMMWLAGALVALLLVLLAGAVVVTHRIAGPAFVLARTCREVGEGRLSPLRQLRSRDLLLDLAGDVADMVDGLRAREERERSSLRAAADRLRDPGASPQERARAIEDLERMAAEKAQRLEA